MYGVRAKKGFNAVITNGTIQNDLGEIIFSDTSKNTITFTNPLLDNFEAGSNVEAESIKATCTDVTIATTKVKGETVVISSCETSYPCVSGGTSVYVINV